VPSKQRLLHIDYNIPDLIAVPHGHDLSSTEAYKTGQIILQDKASCFPAYLLDPSSFNGDIVDTCAAPGNKTTHLAALFHSSNTDLNNSRKVFAFERNEERSLVLKKMVTRAGGDKIITVFGSKDFLAVNPRHSQFANVEGLLLDPSCSGTGIVGRDDEQNMSLPEPNTTTTDARRVPKKRRRHEARESKQPLVPDDEVENDFVNEYKTFEERLRTLSAFQLQLVERAMRFPRATKITYSTCSIYAEENEMVVVRALASKVAKDAGWQIMKRHDQPSGLRKWEVRGLRQACLKDAAMSATTPSDEIADACIRCEKGTKDGTMGFFVAAFVRDSAVVEKAAEDFEALDEGEWRGFSEKDEP
jgi:putative methyltransferase